MEYSKFSSYFALLIHYIRIIRNFVRVFSRMKAALVLATIESLVHHSYYVYMPSSSWRFSNGKTFPVKLCRRFDRTNSRPDPGQKYQKLQATQSPVFESKIERARHFFLFRVDLLLRSARSHTELAASPEPAIAATRDRRRGRLWRVTVWRNSDAFVQVDQKLHRKLGAVVVAQQQLGSEEEAVPLR